MTQNKQSEIIILISLLLPKNGYNDILCNPFAETMAATACYRHKLQPVTIFEFHVWMEHNIYCKPYRNGVRQLWINLST